MKKFAMLFMLLLTLAACGGGGESEGPKTAVINVTMHDIYYGEDADNVTNPPVWTVPAGASVTVLIDNQGALEHNWIVLKAGESIPATFDVEANADAIFYNAGTVEGTGNGNVTFTAPAEPGEYAVVCSVPGHAGLMQGKLVVTQ